MGRYRAIQGDIERERDLDRQVEMERKRYATSNQLSPFVFIYVFLLLMLPKVLSLFYWENGRCFVQLLQEHT